MAVSIYVQFLIPCDTSKSVKYQICLSLCLISSLFSCSHSLCAVLSSFSCVRFFVTQWTIACQTPHPWDSSGDPPNSGIKPTSLTSPALAGGFFTTSTTWEALRSGGLAAIHRNYFICFKQTQISDRHVLTQLLNNEALDSTLNFSEQLPELMQNYFARKVTSSRRIRKTLVKL